MDEKSLSYTNFIFSRNITLNNNVIKLFPDFTVLKYVNPRI